MNCYSWYEESPTVASVLPTTGPVSGSTAVSVTGTNYLSTYVPVCMFGTYSPVTASVLSSTLLKCFSPMATGGVASVNVQVSMNNQDYTTNVVLYQYQGTPSLCCVLY